MNTKSFYFRIPVLLTALLAFSFSAQLLGQCTNIHPVDLAALQALYRSTNGDHWTDVTHRRSRRIHNLIAAGIRKLYLRG